LKILVTVPKNDFFDSFFNDECISAINSMGEAEWNDTEYDFTPCQLREKLKDVDVCFCGWGTTKFDSDVLENADKLKIIAYTAGSVANLVDDAVFDKGIKVLSGNKVFAESVAEGVLAYILTSLRRIPHYNDIMHNGGWQNDDFYNGGLLDKTVGIVSFGAIAKYLVTLIKPFRVKIKVYSRYISDEDKEKYGVEQVPLDEIFSTCDVISIHTAQNPRTLHMIDKKYLQLIKKDALFINTSRGSVVNEEDLINELSEKRFSAVLDVYEYEPLDKLSPLRDMDNVVLMPHMAGPTLDRRSFVTRALVDDVNRYYNNQLMNNEVAREYALNMTR